MSERDFSYDRYWQIIDSLSSDRRRVTFGETYEMDLNVEPILLVRHDIDIDPLRALDLATRESQKGIRATYFVNPSSKHYELTGEPLEAVHAIADLGHEIGLHYDCFRNSAVYRQEVGVARDISWMAEVFRANVYDLIKSFSLHYPTRSGVQVPERVLGKLVNANADEYTKPESGAMYATDSGGNWSYGDPVPRASRFGGNVIQLLTHPVWWGETTKSRRDIIAEIMDGKSTTQKSILALLSNGTPEIDVASRLELAFVHMTKP